VKNISDAADLVATAREALLNDLLPSLPKDLRYVGLMIANAMAIALREQHASSVVEREEEARLRELVAGSAQTLPDLRRALSTDIRRGRFDEGAQQAALVAHLARTAADWLAISNPKALRP
jgi:Domain of unknown function (DUF6285)